VRARRAYRRGVRLAALVLVLAALSASVAQARPARPAAPQAIKHCIGTGAAWKRGTVSGSRYAIVARGVTCTFVKRWVPRLSRFDVMIPGQRLTTGPAGFKCVATVPVDGKAKIGVCGTNGGRGFSWAPKYS
jgi:hypothetical protein